MINTYNNKDMISIARVELTQDIILEIGKFCILWHIFEDELCDNNCTSGKLKELTENIVISDFEVISHYATTLQGRVDILANGVEEYVRYNLIPEKANKVTADDRKAIIQFIDSNGKEALAGCFLSIYRIRNNMFHGLKELQSINNQIELFRAMNSVLENIVR